MGRPKKERKFLHLLALNGGAGTYLTTFATPSLAGEGGPITAELLNQNEMLCNIFVAICFYYARKRALCSAIALAGYSKELQRRHVPPQASYSRCRVIQPVGDHNYRSYFL
jgi:hypothetical protein